MTDVIPDVKMLGIMKQDASTSNLSDEALLYTAKRTWFLVHGIASLIASGMLVYNEDNVKKILLASIGYGASIGKFSFSYIQFEINGIWTQNIP